MSCLLSLIAMSGCSQLTSVCTSDLRWNLTPRERTLRVGESFTPELTLLGCGGSERLSDTVTWKGVPESVVAVDVATGRVTAVAAGEATVTGTAEQYGVSDVVQVTVIAP